MSEPRTIAMYDVERRLGSTGPTEAFRARLAGSSEPVVLKRLQPRLAAPENVQAFLEMARAAALLDHPHIAEMYETRLDAEGLPFTVMEFVDGPTIAQILLRATETGELPLPRLVSLFVGAASALDHAHHARGPDGQLLGLVHGDVSIDNLRVTLDGVTKVLDFGQLRFGAVTKNKVRHLAPELLCDPCAKPTPASDVFGLGVCLHLATTGAWPFAGVTDEQLRAAAAEGRCRRPTDLLPEFPAALEETILAALHADPAKRPTAREIAERMTAWLATTGDQMTDHELGEFIRRSFSDRHHGTPILQELFPSPAPMDCAWGASVAECEPEVAKLSDPAAEGCPRVDPFAALSSVERAALAAPFAAQDVQLTRSRRPLRPFFEDFKETEAEPDQTSDGDLDFTSADVLFTDLTGTDGELVLEPKPPRRSLLFGAAAVMLLSALALAASNS